VQSFQPPYRCDQAAHTSSDCSRYFQSTSYNTAQLCEWHGLCVASTVVPCQQPPPPSPPPSPGRPPPDLIAIAQLTREALRGNASKIEAAKQIHHAVTNAAKDLERTVRSNYLELKPVVEEGAQAVADQVGMQPWQVKAAVGSVMLSFITLFIYAFMYVPVQRSRSRRRQAQLIAAFELMEQRRMRNIQARKMEHAMITYNESAGASRPTV